MSNTASSIPACRSPSSREPRGHRRDGEVPRLDVGDLLPRTGAETEPARRPPHRVGAGDGVVAGVLVVVDEDRAGLAVLAPPRRVTSIRRPALDLARERPRRPAHVGEAVVGDDAHVDVQALAAGGLGVADRAELVEHLAHDAARRAARGEPDAGIGSRSMRHSSGRLDVVGAGVPGVELDGRHLHRPDHVGSVGDARARRRRGCSAGSAPARSGPSPGRPSAAASGGPSRRRRRRGSGAACTAGRAAR